LRQSHLVTEGTRLTYRDSTEAAL